MSLRSLLTNDGGTWKNLYVNSINTQSDITAKNINLGWPSTISMGNNSIHSDQSTGAFTINSAGDFDLNASTMNAPGLVMNLGDESQIQVKTIISVDETQTWTPFTPLCITDFEPKATQVFFADGAEITTIDLTSPGVSSASRFMVTFSLPVYRESGIIWKDNVTQITPTLAAGNPSSYSNQNVTMISGSFEYDGAGPLKMISSGGAYVGPCLTSTITPLFTFTALRFQ